MFSSGHCLMTFLSSGKPRRSDRPIVPVSSYSQRVSASDGSWGQEVQEADGGVEFEVEEEEEEHVNVCCQSSLFVTWCFCYNHNHLDEAAVQIASNDPRPRPLTA
jgi:hypothetical protein